MATVIRLIVAACPSEKPTHRSPLLNRQRPLHSVWPEKRDENSPEQSLPQKPEGNSRGLMRQTEPRTRKGGILRKSRVPARAEYCEPLRLQLQHRIPLQTADNVLLEDHILHPADKYSPNLRPKISTSSYRLLERQNLMRKKIIEQCLDIKKKCIFAVETLVDGRNMVAGVT